MQDNVTSCTVVDNGTSRRGEVNVTLTDSKVTDDSGSSFDFSPLDFNIDADNEPLHSSVMLSSCSSLEASESSAVVDSCEDILLSSGASPEEGNGFLSCVNVSTGRGLSHNFCID